MAIQAVIFDIGNVLIEWQPERYYDAKVGEARRRAMFAAVDLHAMNEQLDRGAPFRETVHATAQAYPEFAPEIHDWYENWIKLAAPVIPHSVHLQRALRARGVPVFALTNFGKESFEYSCSIYAFLTEFDRFYVSGRMGVTKPDPEIYRRVEEDCGLPPDSLLFADDRADNIAAARARGWQAHLFEHPQGWADRLVAEGLLSAQEAAR